MLGLDLNLVSRLEGTELPGPLGQSVLHGEPPDTVGLLSFACCLSPLLSGGELSWLEGKGVSEDAPEDYLSEAESCDGTWGVPVGQEGLHQGVSVQGASLRRVAADLSLRVFNSQFCSFVSPGVVSRGDSVDDPPA